MFLSSTFYLIALGVCYAAADDNACAGMIALEKLDGPDLNHPSDACLTQQQAEWDQKLTDESCASITNCEALTAEYDKIFPHGNRNAASHKWAERVLYCNAANDDEDWPGYTAEKFTEMMQCFCPISGSPIRPTESTCFQLGQGSFKEAPTYPSADGPNRPNSMIFCCWPCICDARNYFGVHRMTVPHSDGDKEHTFLTLPDPCQNPDLQSKINDEGQFDVKIESENTNFAAAAPDVYCGTTADGGHFMADANFTEDGKHVIYGMLFTEDETSGNSTCKPVNPQGSSDDCDADSQDPNCMCENREESGNQSGMGMIFIHMAKMAYGKLTQDETEEGNLRRV